MIGVYSAYMNQANRWGENRRTPEDILHTHKQNLACLKKNVPMQAGKCKRGILHFPDAGL